MDSRIIDAIRVLVLATLCVAGQPAWAQQDPRACVGIPDDIERLECFDAAFSAEAVPIAGDLPSVTLTSLQLIPARPQGRQPAEMIVACEDGTLSVRFRFAGQLVSATSDFAAITFQLDQRSRTRSLTASADNTELGFWTTREASEFLDSLVGVNNLGVRVTPVNQRSLSIRFDIGGFEDEIRSVRDACA